MFQKGNKLGHGRPKGKSINDEIRKAVEKAAKAKKKTVGDYLWNLHDDAKWHGKLVDKFISDASSNVNLAGEGFVFKIVTHGKEEW
jgi:hypothetical protein